MLIWLWDVGAKCGVAQYEQQALGTAARCLADSDAESARVEAATFQLDSDLEVRYDRTGNGWTASRRADGIFAWLPFGQTPERGNRSGAAETANEEAVSWRPGRG